MHNFTLSKNSAAIALLAGCCAWAVSARASERLDLPEGFHLWQPSGEVRLGIGCKDNVTLSSYDPLTSGFETATVEAMLFRLPWNNWQFSAFASGTDIRYFDQSTGVDTEQTAAASAQLGWFLGDGWKNTSTLQYLFLNQVMDVSETYGIPLREQVFGHGITWKEGVRKDWGKNWAELEFSVARFLFDEPLDDYWQWGPQLTLGHYYGNRSEVSLSYQCQPLVYDSREQADAAGLSIPGTGLEFLPQRVEAAWRHFWDPEAHWRSTTRIDFEWNRDNGTGYYDYNEYRLVEELSYRPRTWELTLRASLARYDSPHQNAGTVGFTGRTRDSLTLGLRVEKRLSKHWKVYAAYDFERSWSNLASDNYPANTGSAGLVWGY